MVHRLFVFVLTAFAVLAMPAGVVVAQTESSFTGTSSARLVGIDVTLDPPVSFESLVDGGHAVAQAQVDSLGSSTAFASDPSPGGAVIGLPAFVGFLLSEQLGENFPEPVEDSPLWPLPDYPLFASSSHPTQSSDTVEAGTVVMEATSTSVASTGSVTDGSSWARARTALEPSSGEVVSQAESLVTSLDLGLITLQGVRSLAEVRQTPSGELSRRAVFEVGSLTIFGVQVAVTEDGLSLPDSEPLPLGFSSVEPLLDELGEHGVTIELVPEAKLEDGVASAGLRITVPVQPPPELASGINRLTAVVTLGENIASVSNMALPDFEGQTVPPPRPPIDASPPSPPSPPSAPSASSEPVNLAPPTTAPVAGEQVSAPEVATPSELAPEPPAVVEAAPALAVPEYDLALTGVYPSVAFAAALLFVAARLFARLGGTVS